MRNYCFETEAKVSKNLCNDWYIDPMYIPRLKICARNIYDATHIYLNHISKYVPIKKSTFKHRKAILEADHNNENHQVGYYFGVRVPMEDDKKKMKNINIGLWVKIIQENNPFD